MAVRRLAERLRPQWLDRAIPQARLLAGVTIRRLRRRRPHLDRSKHEAPRRCSPRSASAHGGRDETPQATESHGRAVRVPASDEAAALVADLALASGTAGRAASLDSTPRAPLDSASRRI